jgi:hypothetical protein
MRIPLLISFLALPLCAAAQTQVVASGHLKTAPGIGGDAQTGYAFTKGDVITIKASASKQLDRMLVLIDPDEEVGRVRATKEPQYTFTMPHNGIVVFRFISDRGHTNEINYTVTRVPASASVANYDTRVIWEKPPAGKPGSLIPRRAADVANR